MIINKESDMGWKTVYIVGRDGFHEDVLKNLERSDIQFMPGYHTGQITQSHDLFWVPENMEVRDFKLAIGGKTIFKYRLRFFLSLEEFIETLNDAGFTEEEQRKVEQMRMTDPAA